MVFYLDFIFHNLTVLSLEPETINLLSSEISNELIKLSCFPIMEYKLFFIFHNFIQKSSEPETKKKLSPEIANDV
jgi:hypothetical protein